MKRTAFAAMLSPFLSVLLSCLLSCSLSGAVQAAAIDLSLGQPDHAPGMAGTSVQPRVDPASMPAPVSELPEPEVLAMMLVGLVLIGYKVGRDSSEKFRQPEG